MIFEADIALAVSRVTRPMGPAPRINTTDPSVTPAFLQACTPTDNGSSRAPSSRETLSGNLQIN